jgi:hypothetical protein
MEGLVSRSPRLYAVASIVLWAVIVTTSVWQLVGIWRAAKRYLEQGSPRLWANLARAAVVVGTIQIAIQFASIGIPQISEYALIAIGHDSIGTYNIRVLRNSTEIEVSGAMTYGLTHDVRKVLDKYPAISVIHLNSNGGRVSEARNLRDLIASRELTTYTASACDSACTLAYAAGRKRLIAENARLGFHQYSFPGASGGNFRAEYEKDKKDWLARGFSEFFVAKAFTTPSNEMWRPSHDELFRWDVITGYPGNDDVAATGITQETVDEILATNPMLLALKEHDAKAYAVVVSQAKVGLKQGKSPRELSEAVFRSAYQIVQRKLPYASDFALRRLIAVQRDEIHLLTARPALCYAYVFLNESERALDATKHFSKEMVHRHYAALGEVVRSTSLGYEPPDRQQIEKIRADLARRYGNLGQRGQPVPEGNWCEIAYDFYERILRLSEQESGALLRALYS